MEMCQPDYAGRLLREVRRLLDEADSIMQRQREHIAKLEASAGADRAAKLAVRVVNLEAAARTVTAFDWSDNDADAVQAIDVLRKLVGSDPPKGS